MSNSISHTEHHPSPAERRFREVAKVYRARFGHPGEHLTYRAPDAVTDSDYEQAAAALLHALDTGTPHPLCQARRDRIIEQLCSGRYEYNRWGENADVMDILTCDLTSLRSITEHRRAVFAAIHELTPVERSTIPRLLRQWWHGDVYYRPSADEPPLEDIETAYPRDGRHMVKAFCGGGSLLTDELQERIEQLKNGLPPAEI